MPDLIKIHQIQFWLGLCPRPHWGSLSTTPELLAEFQGIGREKGRKDKEKETEGRDGEGEGRDGTPLFCPKWHQWLGLGLS